MSQQVRTYCRICEAACGLIAELDEEGKVKRLKPDRDHPVSRGFGCAKGTRFAETASGAHRVLTPAVRRDGQWHSTSWDDALSEAVGRIRPILEKYGPHSVGVYYGNPMLFNFLGLVSLIAFNRALGTRNVYSSFSVDCNNKFAVSRILHGAELVHPIPDLEAAELAVMFGSNPAVSQGSFVHLEGGSTAFDRFREKGGRSIWIDPRRSESAARWADPQDALGHLAIKPGSDVYLIMALLQNLSDLYEPHPKEKGLMQLLQVAAQYPADEVAALVGLPEGQIRALANQIRTTRRVTFHASVGLNMGPFGTLAYMGLQALAWLTGNFDQEGGVLFHPVGSLASSVLRRIGIGEDPESSRIGGFTGSFDELPVGILPEEILTEGEGQIRAVIIIGGNPLRSVPGESRMAEALASLDTMISIDLFENETSEFSDVFLPTTSWLERFDIAVAGGALQRSEVLQYAGPVQEALGNVRHERAILDDLAQGLGLSMMGGKRRSRAFARWNLDRRLPALLDTVLAPARWLGKYKGGLPSPVPRPGAYLKRGTNHEDGKLHFWDDTLQQDVSRLEQYQAREIADHPDPHRFRLISRRRRIGHNSWIHAGHRGLPKSKDECAQISPHSLEMLGWSEGDPVRLQVGKEILEVQAMAQEGLAAGVVVLPHGLHKFNVNALFPGGAEMVEPVSGNHIMTGLPVRVEVVKSHIGENQG